MTPHPGVTRRSRNRSPSTPTRTTHASQPWQGTSEGRTKMHTDPNIPARRGRAQPKPEPRHIHPHRTPRPGAAGYKPSAHANTHTPQHPSQEWRGAARTRAQAHTPTPHTQARSGRVRKKRAHNHKRPKIPARNGGLQARTQAQPHRPQTPARKGGVKRKTVPNHTQPRPQPGVAGLP